MTTNNFDSKRREDRDSALGLDENITRRDFVGGTLLGAGAMLLGMQAPSVISSAQAQTVPLPLSGVGPEWTGPGGIGDYARSNGNTHEVINAAHESIRNGHFAARLKAAQDSGETYDLVIVGAGFAGMSAALTYLIERPNARVLILDNHAIFGGEAK